jgi:hypothetical protein
MADCMLPFRVFCIISGLSLDKVLFLPTKVLYLSVVTSYRCSFHRHIPTDAHT